MLTKVKTVTMLTTFCSLGEENKTKLVDLATERTCYNDNRILPQNSKSYRNLQNEQDSEYECVKFPKHRFNDYQSAKNVSVTRWPIFHRLKRNIQHEQSRWIEST